MSVPYVYKLGGSSVSSIGSLHHFSNRLLTMGDTPGLVVVSALSKVTDTLIQFARAALDNQTETCFQIIDQLRLRHLTMITQSFPASIAPEVARELLTKLDTLREKLNEVTDTMGPEEQDAFRDEILSYGEGMSSILVRHFLAQYHPSVLLIDARQLLVTDNHFGDAEPLAGPTQARLVSYLHPLLQPGTLVVTQGFCGATECGQTTTLGRGGSDFSATYLGALLGAAEIEIRTDTPGVLSADPRSVDQTFTIREISHERASTLAHFGAKVLHHRCIEPVVGTDIPIRVVSSFDPEAPGTLIGSRDQEDAFSVTKRLGWIQHWERGPQEDVSVFRERLTGLQSAKGVLASAVNETEAWFAWSQKPVTEVEGVETKESHLSTGLLYVMTHATDTFVLEALREELIKKGSMIEGAFIDPTKGLVYAFEPTHSAHVCSTAHRFTKSLLAKLAQV